MDQPSTVYLEIAKERTRQDEIHAFHFLLRLSVLMEEVGEVATAIQNGDDANLREELIQVAAVAVRWIEAMDK
jgi:NTP pyrophosphatase (non-canonical NTP hydrolase)